ncbi:hypothetical protein Raf01_63980 [Rugosimonospora africana]|uniref:Uncharacterized protein n=1 Tax=Rugosimonospora africana TaxID=556532 RepID=A0A8J3QXA1_9ACTN|nr:hypothetical protein Raf01_63980 [Rugosimonospora africana]
MYLATYRLSWAVATRAASCPHGSVGPVGPALGLGSTGGGMLVQPVVNSTPTRTIAAVPALDRTESLWVTQRPDRGIDSPRWRGAPVPWVLSH